MRFAPLSKYLEDYSGAGTPYDGYAAVARLGTCTDDLVVRSATFGSDELTRPYDTGEIGEILARITLGCAPKAEPNRKYICSELVFECFKQGGYEFGYDPRGFISPENIWMDPNVALQARIL